MNKLLKYNGIAVNKVIMEKEKNKKFEVKRETRTNSENEPTRVYRPRTLKARPVSNADDSTDNNRNNETQESNTFDSETPKVKYSDEKPSRKKKDSTPEENEGFEKPSSKSKDEIAEKKSTYKPRTGGFKKSNEEFSADINRDRYEILQETKSDSFEKESSSDRRSIERPSRRRDNHSDSGADDRPARRSVERRDSSSNDRPSRRSDDRRESNSYERPSRRSDDRRDSNRDDRRTTSRRTEGKPTGYRSSRVVRDDDRPRGSREEGFRRDRNDRDDRPKFGERTRERKPYGSRSESDSKSKLRIILTNSNEKKFIDKPTPKTQREYDDKPFLEVDSDGLIRLNKYISNTGLCSRREADEFIENGMITVNGEVVNQLGTKINPEAEVCFKGKKLETEHKVYILLNKPKDYITTVEDPNAKRTVMELIEDACTERVYPVGRLDRNSTGLLLLTNDGELTKKLTHPSFEKKKIYHVGLDKVLSREDMQKMLDGVDVEGEIVKADAIEYTEESDGTEVGVEIHTGQNRVVRNMFGVLGYKVSRLDRVYFAGLTKKNLPRGSWRFLTQKEVNMLKMNRFD